MQWNLEFLRPAQDWELECFINLFNSISHGLGWAGKTRCVGNRLKMDALVFDHTSYYEALRGQRLLQGWLSLYG